MGDIVLIGGGGHALSVADAIIKAGKYRIAGYTDNEKVENGLTYLGTDDSLSSLYDNGTQNAAVCIGYLGKGLIRDRLYKSLKYIGYELPVILDPSAVISQKASIGEGTFIGKNSVVNAGSVIGKMCIINTGAVVEHTNHIGDFSHIAVGATLCGDVTVGDYALVGANATVLQGIKIGMNCIIGAGSIVLSDVPDNMQVVGIWGGCFKSKILVFCDVHTFGERRYVA